MNRRRRASYLRPATYRRRQLLVACGVFLLAALLAWWQWQREPSPPEALPEGRFRVDRVVDGDTLLLANGARIRLIGADTPETVKPGVPKQAWGPEATRFTQDFVAGGTVRLQMDRERVDRYGRFLAYVWVEDRMLNEELIRSGLARARTEFFYSRSMKTRFTRAEQEAKDAGRGIWSQR